jgi:V/A-type H+-transporting ATPase subunit D
LSLEARKVLPTKINYIKLRREERTIRRVRKVLEEKREVLLLHIRESIDYYERYYNEVSSLLREAYQSYFRALASLGYEQVRSIAESTPSSLRLEVEERALFAVKVPALELVADSIAMPSYSLAETPIEFSEAYLKMRKVLSSLVKLIEVEASLRSLIEELRETQRLINAIDYALLPAYERAIHYIRLILDERMREEFIRLKMLKRKLAGR